MDYHFYHNTFQGAVTGILKEKLENNGLDFSVDIVLDSVALKVYKPEWSSELTSPLDAAGRIFFSIWINDKTIQEGRVYYNIHALKLRAFKKYALASRQFAEDFRIEFQKYQKEWPNVNVKYGPLTLMQGWIDCNAAAIQENIGELIQSFFKVSPIIDTVLEHYKK